jgi:hypothetical protein
MPDILFPLLKRLPWVSDKYLLQVGESMSMPDVFVLQPAKNASTPDS